MDENFSLLSWNLNGLSEENLKVRTLAAIDQIRELKPGIVFLQEVVPYTASMIISFLKGPYYYIVPEKESNWHPDFVECQSKTTGLPLFSMILASKYHFEGVDKKSPESLVYYYPSTQMGRNLLITRLQSKAFTKTKITVATSHLESLAKNADERILQLKTAITWMGEEINKLGDSGCVLFGGDLNVRDSEVELIPDLMEKTRAKDLWIMSGKPSNKEYTYVAWKKGYRFDRIYGAFSDNFPFRLAQWDIVGTKSIGRGPLNIKPSDHYGIVAHFQYFPNIFSFNQDFTHLNQSDPLDQIGFQ